MRRTRKRAPQLALPWERIDRPLRTGVNLRRMWPMVGLAAALGTLVGTFFLGTRQVAVASTRALLGEVRSATRSFVSDVGRCPRDARELVHPPRSGTQYLGEAPVDAWGHPIYLRCSEDTDRLRIEVLSAGPSGSFMDEDNIM